MDYKKISQRIKKSILENSFKAGACHIKSALSCVDILIDLFYRRMKKGDIFLFGKASGVSALYCILADKGYFPQNKIVYYLKNYPLPSKEVPGVIHSVGSLGHSLPFAVGMAYADRNRKVYVLIGDGDVQEGTFWESILFKQQHKLDNLHIIWDSNGLQALGKVDDILKLPKKFIKSCGVEIVETKIGIDFMEKKYEWHYKNLTKEQLSDALKQI